MPKRKTIEEKMLKYKNKLRKLQERRYRHSRSRSLNTDSGESGPELSTGMDLTPRKRREAQFNRSIYGEHSRVESYMDITSLPSAINVSEKENVTPNTGIQEEAELILLDPESHSENPNTAQAESNYDEPTLDIETLQALGDPILEKPKYGSNINPDLAKRCITILRNGLDKDTRESLLKDYLIPENCQMLQAPRLNPEIIATITDTIKNRDTKIETEQQQLGQGITALNKALSLLVTNTGDRLTTIKTLSDASKILTDLHSRQTISRKKLITPLLDKKFLEVIKDVERDEFLYGANLSDKIRAMKNAQKSGQTIKKSDNFKAPANRIPGNFSSSGNFRGPPRYQAPKPYNRSGQKRSATGRNPPPPYKQPHHPMRKTKQDMKPPAQK